MIDDWENFDGAITDLQVRAESPSKPDSASLKTPWGCVHPRSKPRLRTGLSQPVRADGGNSISARRFVGCGIPREAAHLWESHPWRGILRVENKLRKSVRRWLSERELLVSLATTPV